MLAFLKLFVHHRALAPSLIMLIVAIALVAWRSLPVQQYPLINSVSIEVETYLSGASAVDVEAFVTKPLETALSGVNEIDYIDSRSMESVSKITLWLNLNTAANDVLADVNAKLTSARTALPANTEFPQVQVKRTDRPWATFYISFSSENGSLIRLTDEVNANIRPIISSIPGVQRVTMEAPAYPAIRIYFDLAALDDYAVTPSEIISQLGENHDIAAIGRFKTEFKDIFVTANSLNYTLDDFRTLPITLEGDTQIPLSYLADITMGEERPLQRGFFSDKSAFYLGVWPAPGENEIELAERLQNELEEIRKTLPDDVNMVLNYDATRYMREALSEVSATLFETVCIVAFVVLLFLGKVRTVSIPIITIPLSIGLTLIVMSLAGFSINLLTMLAIVLSIGLVVDDAIVMVEYIERKIRAGHSAQESALSSIDTLTKPIISMTLTMAVVFFPVSLIDGISGALFYEFAITMAVLLLSSGIVCLLFAPFLGAKLIRHSENGIAQKLLNNVESKLTATYLRFLRKVLVRPIITAVTVVSVLALSVPLYSASQKELAPVEDQGGVGFIVESYPDANLDYTAEQAQKSINEAIAVEGVDYAWSLIGAKTGFGGLELVDWDDRQQSAFDVYAEASTALAKNEKIVAYPFLYPPLPGAGNFDVEIVIKLPESTSNLSQLASNAVSKLYESGAFTFVDTNIKHDQPVIRLEVDWNEARKLGVTAQSFNRDLSTLYAEYRVSMVAMNGRNYEVIPSVIPSQVSTFETLLGLNVHSADGKQVRLGEFATVRLDVVQRELSRFQQKNAIHIYGLKVAAETRETALNKALDVLQELLPPGSQLDFKGESRQIKQSETSIFYSIGIALFLVFIILSIQFNGYAVPFAILLSTVPLSLFSALMFTALGFTTLNIYSQIGLLTLAGLITKNGILMVEYAEAEFTKWSELKVTVLKAAEQRFRPILMTTVATVFGHLPLTMVTGAGAEARNSIGIVLVAGMAIGAVISLFVTPTIYLAIKQVLTRQSAKLS